MASRRRIGAAQSETRTRLLDAAEQIILEEGYAAVTTRHVGRCAGITPQLVHYYFRTMDELFLEVFRRRASNGLRQYTEAVESGLTLRQMWELRRDIPGAVFNVEFVALGNHRKAVRAEIAEYARRFRRLQLDAFRRALAQAGVAPDELPPVVAALALTGITQVIAVDDVIGLDDGHAEAIAFIERWLDQLEPSPVEADRTA